MFLSHINYLLHKFGLRGLNPSNLDYIALSETFYNFQRAFHRHVLNANKQSFHKINSLIIQIENDNKHHMKSDLVHDQISVLASFHNYHRDLFFPLGNLATDIIESPLVSGMLVGILIQSLTVPITYVVHTKYGNLTANSIAGPSYLGIIVKCFLALCLIIFILYSWTIGTPNNSIGFCGISIWAFASSLLPAALTHNIYYQLRYSDSSWSDVCENGEYCGSEYYFPITGLKIWLSD